MAPRVASRWVLVVGTILVIATVSAATTMLFMGTASPLMRSHSSSKRENQQQHRRQRQPSAAPPSPPLPSRSRTPVTATAPALQQQHTDLPPPPPPAVAAAPVPIVARTWQQVQSLVQRLPDAPPLDVAPAVLASDRGFSDAYNFHSRNSDPEFGVRELVLGNEPPGPFMVNPAYTTGVSDDRAVARHYAALQRGGHPKLQRPPQNKDTGWQENFLTACTSVQQSFEGTNPRVSVASPRAHPNAAVDSTIAAALLAALCTPAYKPSRSVPVILAVQHSSLSSHDTRVPSVPRRGVPQRSQLHGVVPVPHPQAWQQPAPMADSPSLL